MSKNRMSTPNICNSCKEKRPRSGLGISMDDFHVYCMDGIMCGNQGEHPGTLVPLSELKETLEEMNNPLLDKLMGKSVSFRLPPYLALHLAKYIQLAEHGSVNAVMIAILEEHAIRHDYSSAELTDKVPAGKGKYIDPDFIEAKEEAKEKENDEEFTL